jgi:hypothetical protein
MPEARSSSVPSRCRHDLEHHRCVHEALTGGTCLSCRGGRPRLSQRVARPPSHRNSRSASVCGEPGRPLVLRRRVVGPPQLAEQVGSRGVERVVAPRARGRRPVPARSRDPSAGPYRSPKAAKQPVLARRSKPVDPVRLDRVRTSARERSGGAIHRSPVDCRFLDPAATIGPHGAITLLMRTVRLAGALSRGDRI